MAQRREHGMRDMHPTNVISQELKPPKQDGADTRNPNGSTRRNRKTAHLGRLAQPRMERATRPSMETAAIQEIKPTLDFRTY